jgi:proteic killer suppression protein
MAIQSFADASTEKFFITGKVNPKTGWVNVQNVAKRKLDMLHYATKLFELKSPPNNHLEELKRDLVGLHSIRINKQWRIVFKWTDAGPTEVRIEDYH